MGSHQQNGGIHRPPAAAEVVVVMVPFVAHGHLNQLLHLSHLISSYNVPVHFVTTTTHIRQLRSRHHNSDHRPTTTAPIHFQDFPTPPFTSPLPDHSNRFPCHLQPAFDSTLHLRPHLANLVLSLAPTARRVAVVHDFLMSYVVQDVQNIPNAETYIFNPLSACATFWIDWERLGRPFPVDSPEILKRIPSGDGSFSPEFVKLVELQYPHANSHVGELFDSSRAIEGEYLEYLQRKELKGSKKLWAIGPVNRGKNSLATVSENRHKCLRWLDLQPPNSVVYVSFGTTTTFSDEQIKELAVGIERSRQRFVWVARAADKGDVFCDEAKMAQFPDGFEAAVEGRGLVVREWAPQLDILGHLATGGFMSHCGWNSTTESISKGVPMITWPMHSDQPRNAFLITDVLRIGLAAYNWEHRDELVTSVVVEDLIRRIIDSREGVEMRKRAAELADSVRRSVADGGESCKEIDSFISYIKRE